MTLASFEDHDASYYKNTFSADIIHNVTCAICTITSCMHFSFEIKRMYNDRLKIGLRLVLTISKNVIRIDTVSDAIIR